MPVNTMWWAACAARNPNTSPTATREVDAGDRVHRRTRRELADAALRLFDERGYAATGVADIAAAAGVSTRTFFSYFPSKEDVLFADTDERLQLV